MQVKAKAAITECYKKNNSGDSEYRDLSKSMMHHLRDTVGQRYWGKAHEYLRHFLARRKERKEKEEQRKKRKAGQEDQRE